MSDLGNYVLYLIMFFVVIGAIGAALNDREGIGAEFMAGIHTLGQIFIPVAAIMVSVPVLTKLIANFVSPLFVAMGSEPAMAATSLISVDLGGYQIAKALAPTTESWLLASMNGFLLAPHLLFTIPVALAILDKRDHKYLALGMIAGLISIPVAFVSILLMINIMEPLVRTEISTHAASTYLLYFEPSVIVHNILPLVLFVGSLALSLKLFTRQMILGFIALGRGADILMKLIFAACVVEYFTGVFTKLDIGWAFDPMIADSADQFRALEIAGYIALMLAGAFPMVYCIQRYLRYPLTLIGRRLGLGPMGSVGLLAAAANPLALWRMLPSLNAKDKVLTIAFAVCAAWMLGDSLAFIANFQPTLIVPLLVGKLIGALAGLGIAHWLSVPAALRYEANEALTDAHDAPSATGSCLANRLA